MIDINSYDHIIIYMSGGKDSLACLLHLLDLGVDPSKVEVWHHLVDGREGSTLMDWPVTESYCQALADHFSLPIYFSWREGGIEREMLRHETATAAIWFETPEGLRSAGGKSNKLGTREKFPQVSPNLRVRWCSSVVKIDVGAGAIRNQIRFLGKRILTISGERRQESAARAGYEEFEPDRTHTKSRHVDRWRPIIDWDEQQVWDIIGRFKVRPHPAYELGWARLSCIRCIFCSADQAASARVVDPVGFGVVATYEDLFGVTIKRDVSIEAHANAGVPFQMDDETTKLAMSTEYPPELIVVDEWKLPAGAFSKDKAGPS